MPDGPSLWGWAFLILAVIVAAVLRFWNLENVPPGLYRDEALNGLDALRVVAGERPLFFAANNGREPAYIYLTALAVSWLGPTTLAVRVVAAFVGTITTLVTYGLAQAWFDRRTALLAAWVWAVTLWPVHLSRLGLRPILLPFLLALTLWWATVAYRKQKPVWWLAAGAVYGAAFYTYVAVRFTPLLLVLLVSYLLLTRPEQRRRLWTGGLWFTAGAGVVVLPLALFALSHLELFLGRPGQVSILNPAINQGNFWGTLGEQTSRSLGLFLWQGDMIQRHNPSGRPLFDLFLAVPFLIGLVWCLVHWRRAAAAALLLWIAVMLGPTILAEDAPHFLRAAGILPAVLLLPALGLSRLGEWPKLPGALRWGIVLVLASCTLIKTIHDYTVYSEQPETAYLFEAAAREMAFQINRQAPETTSLVDKRFWEGWPSLPFLVSPEQKVVLFSPEEGLPGRPALPVAVYAWPYGPLDFVRQLATSGDKILVEQGELARGDLEEAAYPLYVHFGIERQSQGGQNVAVFDETIELKEVAVSLRAPDRLQVDLFWAGSGEEEQPLVTFVHVRDENGIVGQSDLPPAHGYWLPEWWQPEVVIQDRHEISLPVNFNSAQHQIVVGLYEANSGLRLPVTTPDGQPIGDSLLLPGAVQPPEEN